MGFWLRLAAVAALIGLSLGPGTASARLSPTVGDGQGPTLITVDFRALASDGTPIRNLQPEEVTLRVGGRPREIVALQLMEAEGRGDALAAAAAPAPPFITNAPEAWGRDVVLLIDEEGIPAGKQATVNTALGRLVAALSPGDRISVMTSKGSAARVKATTKHQRVHEALAALVGRAMRGETASEAVCRSRVNLFALIEVLTSVAPSVPTVVVFVTNGFTPPTVIEDIKRGEGPASPCELMPRDLETLTNAAVISRAQIYALQIIDDGLPDEATASEMTRGAARATPVGGAAATVVASTADMTRGLEHVAGLTGNAIIRLIGDSSPAVQRIARETSAYYLAAFEVPAAERTGATQQVEVSVARPQARVSAHRWILIPKPQAPSAKPGRSGTPTPRDMLSVARPFYDLPLRASVFPSRASSDGKLRVVALFESSDPSVWIASAAAALFDVKGKARAQWTGQAAELGRPPILAALTAPGPGTYRLRVAAADATGAGGTLDEEVTIAATAKNAPWVGALVLGVPSGQSFAPRLQFVDEAVAMAMVEIAGLSKAAAVEATFELAASEDGPALASLPGTVRPPSGGTTVAYVELPIRSMPPGDVVVRAVITIDGRPLPLRPVRTLRKAAR